MTLKQIKDKAQFILDQPADWKPAVIGEVPDAVDSRFKQTIVDYVVAKYFKDLTPKGESSHDGEN